MQHKKTNKENKSKPRKLIEFKLALERDIAVVDVAHVEKIDTIFKIISGELYRE